MPGRRSFKTDESFLEKLAIGAIGARAVFNELQRQGHRPIELERGSMGYKDFGNIEMIDALPKPLYVTQHGQAYVGDSLDLLTRLPDDSVDLIITSPPFALQRQKEYGNETEDAHVDWLLQFAEPVKRVLKPTGSFVLDLGGAYQSGRPVRSLIEILTDPGDTVLDIFAGSNTTGSAAQKLDRRWMAFEKDRTYLATSAFRFVDELPSEELAMLWSRLNSYDLPVELNREQLELVLMEKATAYAQRRNSLDQRQQTKKTRKPDSRT